MSRGADHLSEFYRILPADIHPVRRPGSPVVHFALTGALTAYCGVYRGTERPDAAVTCLKCMLKWVSSTEEGREALTEAFSSYRAGGR